MTWDRVLTMTAEDRVLSFLDNVGANGPSISSDQFHEGEYSYVLNNNPMAFGIGIPTPRSRNRVGYWLRHSGLGTQQIAYLYLAATAKTQYESPNIGIRIDGVNGNLQVVRPVSGTTNSYEELAAVAIPAGLSLTATWVHLGIYHYLHDSAGVLNLYLNGSLILSYNGDTRMYGQGSGTPAFATEPSFLWICGSYGGSNNLVSPTYVDDYYIETSTDEAPAVVPTRRWGKRTVIGAGTNAQWTPDSGSNYQMVDDVPNDGDTTKNKALTAGLKDTFTFSDVSVPADHRIIAEIPTIYVKNLDVGPLIRVHAFDGSLYAHSADLTPALDYNFPLFARLLTQPDGSDFNETDDNLLEFGYESRGSFA